MAELDAQTGACSRAETEALARLEAALDRIGRRGAIAIPPNPAAITKAAAVRLDALITQLRDALEDGPAQWEE